MKKLIFKKIIILKLSVLFFLLLNISAYAFAPMFSSGGDSDPSFYIHVYKDASGNYKYDFIEDSIKLEDKHKITPDSFYLYVYKGKGGVKNRNVQYISAEQYNKKHQKQKWDKEVWISTIVFILFCFCFWCINYYIKKRTKKQLLVLIKENFLVFLKYYIAVGVSLCLFLAIILSTHNIIYRTSLSFFILFFIIISIIRIVISIIDKTKDFLKKLKE